MSTPDIHDILFDDENEEKLSKRGIYPEHVLDILSEPHIIVRNKRRRRGVYKLVGRDRGGRLLTIIMEATRIKGTWRPVTGWPSSNAEITQYESRR